MKESEPNAWWNTLRHEGVLISPIVLDDWLPDGPQLVEDRAIDKLRQQYYRFTDDAAQLRPFLDAVLEDFLGHSKPNLRKEHDIPDWFKHQGKKPNRVLLNAGKEHQPRFIVLIDDERVADESGKPHRLGLHSGRRKHADLLRLMRATDVKLGVLTNGHHFRLVYGGMDHESWAEWSAEAWFQGGDGRIALHGLFTLLGAKTLAPDSDSDKNELLVKVQESRDRQADLSHVMGTQIREAVELLMEELTDSLTPENRESILAPLRKLGRSKDEELQSLYQGAIRCIMRLIVQLYAESRALLPKQERLYYESYSVEGLYQMLKRAAADGREEELRSLRSAWPRLLASWRAIHDGSNHKDLQIQSYGGQLFRPYAADLQDRVLAAIAVLEDPRVHVSDWAVYEVLEKLRIGKYKVGRGKWRKGPVDFSDLRTEYIGMMYEGLLDYDLREAREEDGGIVFLSIGDQPALPLNVLAAQQPADIKRLIKEESKKNKAGSEAEADEAAEDDYDDEPSEDAEVVDDDESEGTADEQFQKRVTAWATKAAEIGGLFGCTPAKLKKLDVPQREKLLLEAGHKLVFKAIPPGGMYLVRWSGTRKGSGTFYTKPGLAVPTTVRTLEPLVYENHEDREHRVVRRPEAILALKICDPAMGSGSFLVAALRFLAGALKESFEKYVIPKVESGEFKATETGETAMGLLTERILRNRHEDHSGERMESALKRAVVEHCIYGVDLNPLAVELGKLSLWIETMDPTLRFTFLDHKIKCGNSLVGTWRNQAHIYPLAAWDRDFGDGPQNPRTKRAKLIRKQVILPELKVWLDGWKLTDLEKKVRAPKMQPAAGQRSLFGGGAQQVALPSTSTATTKLERIATQTTFAPLANEESWESRRQDELRSLKRIHAIADPREQEEDYRRLVIDSPAHQEQKYWLDKWCAVWFWPVKAEPSSALDAEPILGPRKFYQPHQETSVRQLVHEIASRHRFFHWELEFPDVFGDNFRGFSALIGNPPWDAVTPDSVAYLGKINPAFRALAPREKVEFQEQFENSGFHYQEYLDYLDAVRATQNFFAKSGNAYSSSIPKDLGEKWGALAGNSRPPVFHLQEERSNLFKMFTELAMALLGPVDCRAGLVLPEGIYAHRSSAPLREYLFANTRLEWLFAFENRARKMFNIHQSYKFAAVVFATGRPTERFRAAFLQTRPEAWQNPQTASTVEFTMEQLRAFSPTYVVVPEFTNDVDKQMAAKIAVAARPLREAIAPIEAGREFTVSEDAKEFQSWPYWEAQGFVRQANGSLVNADGHRAQPVNMGADIHQFDSAYTGSDEDSRGPSLWMDSGSFEKSGFKLGRTRLVYRAVARTDDQRTMIASIIPNEPCVHSIMMLKGDIPFPRKLFLLAVFNSFVFDFVLRLRQTGAYVSWFNLEEMSVPVEPDDVQGIESLSASLVCHPNWLPQSLSGNSTEYQRNPGQRAWAREQLDVAIARCYQLSDADMRYILRPDNPDRRNLWRDYRERLKVLEAAGLKGKWYTLDEAREIRRKAGLAVDF